MTSWKIVLQRLHVVLRSILRTGGAASAGEEAADTVRMPSRWRQVVGGLGLFAAVLSAAGGYLLVTDRPGLRSEYFALEEPWRGERLGSGVGAPRLESPAQVQPHLSMQVVFSVRWSGWWEVTQEGEHRFVLEADDGGYLRIDGRLVGETPPAPGGGAEDGRIELEPGFHRIEVGYYQKFDDARLAISWEPPGSSEGMLSSLPLSDLYVGRPLLLRKAMRRVKAQWRPVYRRLLGAGLLIFGLAPLVAFAFRAGRGLEWIRRLLQSVDRRRLGAGLLAALFVATFFAVLPYTGMVIGGDDTSYLQSATFNDKAWYVNRYGHVYLLKLFTTLSGGDPATGVRVWWSFVMATTVSALAVAVRCVGPGLQLGTMVATFLLLLAQPTIWGLVGTGFADYSSMMFVTVAVATFLAGEARDRERPPPRHEWHALVLGALTVGAFRTKEVGAVIVLLPLLMAIGPSQSLELRRFARKIAYWLVGVVVALGILALLDGLILGDYLFSWDAGRQASLKRMNFPTGVRPRSTSWLDKIWHGEEMRVLWLGVAAAALVAGARRKVCLQLRLLHLMPIVFLSALVVLYVRLPHPFSNRMLIPILPTACFVVGLLLYYAGLDRIAWKRLLAPSVFVPTAFAAAVIWLIAIPLRTGELEAAELLPVELVRRFGWTPELFVSGVLLPAGVLSALGLTALVARERRYRVAALLLVFLVVYGVGFTTTLDSLAERHAVERGKLLLYPWRVFGEELNASRAQRIALSSDLRRIYKMTAATESALARIGLVRRDVHVDTSSHVPTEADAAIASQETYRHWLQEMPTLAESALVGPSEFLVLVRPREAAAAMAHRPEVAMRPVDEQSVTERLASLRDSRSPVEREELIDWVMANEWGSHGLRRLGGVVSLERSAQRGIALYGDGWSYGTEPAGLLIENRSSSPLKAEIALVVGDARRPLPVDVHLDDGESVRHLRFEEDRSRSMELPAIEPGAKRLVLVWAEQVWSPPGDGRELGVQVLLSQRR